MLKKGVKLPIPRAKVVIVDDHPAVREALAIRISSQADLEICGEASDVLDALQVIANTNPDVVVVDIALKTGNGVDLIKRVKDRNSKARMIVWSMFQEELYAERALRAGAMGYLTKEQATSEIIDAIHHILEGRMYLSAEMTEKLLKQATGAASPNASPIDSLSDRELEVFRLIGQGLRNQEIANQLHLSVKTVETYRDRIKDKMALKDSVELNRSALQWILGD
jgi:DNA-binding NarL/FixJ family response regulator